MVPGEASNYSLKALYLMRYLISILPSTNKYTNTFTRHKVERVSSEKVPLCNCEFFIQQLL